MHVKWKVLFIFGFIFWSAMCLTEYYFGAVIHPGEFRGLGIEEEPLSFADESMFNKFSSEFGWRETIIYSLFSFSSSLALCFITKVVKLYIKRRKEREFELSQAFDNTAEVSDSNILIKESKSKSRIPVPIPFGERKSTSDLSTISVHSFTTHSNILDAVRDFPVKTEQGCTRISPRRYEKDCAKLKDEMVMLQANSMKEHAALSKKLDGISREKRELAKQLAESQKENTLAKIQLDDILSDRSLLIRRLDCATREIKLNTTSKQMTLEKLEEAVVKSDNMRNKIEQLSRDKNTLEERLKMIENKYKSLKEQKMILHEQSQSVKKLWNHQMKKDDLNLNETTQEIDITQSERDMEKVQSKLNDLERSLEKLKVNPKEPSVCVAESSIFSDGDLRNINESLAAMSQSSNDSSDDATLSGNDFHSMDTAEFPDNAHLTQLTDQFHAQAPEEHNKLADVLDTIEEQATPFIFGTANYVKEKFSTCFAHFNLKGGADMTDSEMTLDSSELDSESLSRSAAGIVSNSPAFQKFLLTILDAAPPNNTITTTENKTYAKTIC